MGDFVQAAGTLSGTYAESRAADVEKYGSRTDVKALELAAAQREADRKEALNKALASMNAMAGAGGAGFGGSISNIMKSDVQAEKEATQRDRLMTDIEKRRRYYMSKSGRTLGKQKSLMGYLQGTTELGEAGLKAVKAIMGAGL